MDAPLSRIVAGVVQGARPVRKKRAGERPEREARFSLEERGPDGETNAETPAADEPLHVAPREAEESGGRLDLTA
jgi:hypothetical protein